MSKQFIKNSSSLSPIESAKRKAAFAAVDEFVEDGMVVGIGSGSTVVYAVERLEKKVNQENINVVCIPSSFQATQLIINAKLPLGDLSRYPEIDVTIDGADEVDINLNCIKGGGGCQTQEKIVASNSKQFVVIADYRKEATILGEKWKKGVPVEVIPLAYRPIMRKIETMGGKPVLRMAKSKAGPLVTDNGNFILDVDFGLIKNVRKINQFLMMTPGVVETGLFVNMAVKAFFGQNDGSVTTRSSKNPPRRFSSLGKSKL